LYKTRTYPHKKPKKMQLVHLIPTAWMSQLIWQQNSPTLK